MRVDEYIQELENQIAVLEQRRLEMEELLENLDKFKDTKMIVPIITGIMVEAAIEEPKHIFINVGANVIVKKRIDEARAILETQIREILESEKLLEQEIAKVINSLQSSA